MFLLASECPENTGLLASQLFSILQMLAQRCPLVEEGLWILEGMNKDRLPRPSGRSDSKASDYNVGDLGSIPGLGRSPEEGNGNPFQYSCLEKSHRRRSLVGYNPWGRKELDTTEQLHFHVTILQIYLHMYEITQEKLYPL